MKRCVAGDVVDVLLLVPVGRVAVETAGSPRQPGRRPDQAPRVQVRPVLLDMPGPAGHDVRNGDAARAGRVGLADVPDLAAVVFVEESPTVRVAEGLGKLVGDA